jgi:mono/diheme cytochrome c family protein
LSIHVHTTGVDDATDAHIHRAPEGTNGPVLVGLVQDAADLGHWSVEDHVVTATDLADFMDGLWYVNVHTPAHPNGEVRAQIGPEAAPPGDTTAPTATLGAVAATVSGTIALTASAQDDVGVTSVRILLNGATELGSDASDPYSISWNTTTVPNGPVMLTAEARDAAGNVGLSTAVAVTVNNAAAVTLAQLQTAIFGQKCSGCHTGGGGGLPGSMNLTSASASFAALVNVASQQQPGFMRVKPGDAEASYLIHKLEGRAGISGDRMPQGGPFLSQAEIDSVKAWINAGATNN